MKLKKTYLAGTLVLAAIAGMLAFWWFFKKDTGSQKMNFGGGEGFPSQTVSGEGVSASGVISMGVTEETFGVTDLETEIEIEEVYISSNTEIEQGAKVMKLSEEDIAEAREELEQAFNEAKLAYRAGKISYEQSLITAEYERDAALLEGEQAESVYEETVAGLSSSVDRAREAVEEATEQIEEYASYVNDGSYKEYFQVDAYQQIYDENLELLKSRMEEYGVSWGQVTGGRGNGDNSAYGQEVTMLSSLYKILEQNLKDLEQAEADYEDALANAAFNLQSLELNLPSLEQELLEAEQNYESALLEAELTKETSLAAAERAESDYETAVEKAENDYEALAGDYEDAMENLELFEALVGDGYFYASGSGTVLRSNVRAGKSLTADSTVFMYSDPENMTVTVTVAQEDIGKVAVGDSAVVMTQSYGNLAGVVSEINPVSSSTGRTNVTYSVIVALQGETQDIPANTSVAVMIGQTMPETEQSEPERPQTEQPQTEQSQTEPKE